MAVQFIMAGESRSFPDGPVDLDGNGTLIAGDRAGSALAIDTLAASDFIAIELGDECLADHVGLDPAGPLVRVVGFARFRMGDAAPGPLIELVHTATTDPAAIAAAREAFTGAGFKVAVCGDLPGRIVNRLIRPYLNAVLRRLDDGLASADDMDTTLRLGLGYPEGPNALLARTGLTQHCGVTSALYRMTGDADFAPARRAQVASGRAGR